MSKFLHNNVHSLVLATLSLVFWSFQVARGWHVDNDELKMTTGPKLAFNNYLHSGPFLQDMGENWEIENWQNEFLAVLVIVTLMIFLRQRESPENTSGFQSNSKTDR